MTDFSKHLVLAKETGDFITQSPDPFHSIKNISNNLRDSGFQNLSIHESFVGNLKPGSKYYYTLNDTTIVAFVVGMKFQPGNGFKVIAGHTDTPNLRVKPLSKYTGSSGCIQVGVECYGGGLWHTWFDRDLGISGRVLVRTSSNEIKQKLVKVDKPVARVSTLCIHLQNSEERTAFKVNKENHMIPIISTETSYLKDSVEQQLSFKDTWKDAQEPLLLKLIAEQLDIEVSDIADFELSLFDTQPACIGGINDEFLYSARLDNLATCFVSIKALIEHSSSLEDDEDISLVVLFDHEEVGSASSVGAGSPIMSEAVKRISSSFLPGGNMNTDLYVRTIHKSFVLSVDMAHAIHPNYSSKHEKSHSPKMNAGVVLKSNGNQRYTTNSITGFVIRELSRIANLVPLQEFVVRNDCPCGSTIGPIISSNTGIRCVDAGMPQLSMHSCREVMGTADLTNGLELFKAFFCYFRDIDSKLQLTNICLPCA